MLCKGLRTGECLLRRLYKINIPGAYVKKSTFSKTIIAYIKDLTPSNG